ncbi:MAG: hypothetical protein BGO49_05720 [Planctomycetales bacterium 71-10]|nr:MAG: hypothetical protein BGO49_05720 [Planctomycetales bacterium 71-10]
MHRTSSGPGAKPRPRPDRAATLIAAALLIAFLLLSAPGCGGTQVSGENRELIVSLATAVSTRESKWLDKNAALVEERRAAGKCSDAEYAAFKDIIAKAKAGEWDAAQEAAYALRDAQEPTADDLKHLAERKLDHQPKALPSKARSARKS